MRTRSNYELYHIFKQNGRIAKVYNTESGFEVDLYEGNELIETREVHQHSEYLVHHHTHYHILLAFLDCCL